MATYKCKNIDDLKMKLFYSNGQGDIFEINEKTLKKLKNNVFPKLSDISEETIKLIKLKYPIPR